MFKLRLVFTIIKFLTPAVFFYNEYFNYFILPYRWANHLDCSSSNCVKFLLVADPQILGEDTNKLALWDCDNYLKKTFSYAVNYVQPDIIIFLGDEMDEGHISTDIQFQGYLKRFRTIFNIPNEISCVTIYVPGDNDLGGESGPILPHVVHRFEKEFDQSIEPAVYQNMEFYKINKMTLMFQEPDAIIDGSIRIGVTHMPILRRIHTISKHVAKSIQPHIIFSGHDHSSYHVTAPLDNVWDKTVNTIDTKSSKWFHYPLGKNVVHEIIVPTCSYRMGVDNMGYGFAIVDQSTNVLSYTVLWLPSRLAQLSLYVYYFIIVSFFVLFCVIVFVKRRIQRLIRYVYAKSMRYQH